MTDTVPPSLSLAGLHASSADGAWASGVRGAIAWAAALGYRRIHLDAAAPQIRPRSLDRSGRRDLAATIRRESLGFTGLDLWIPAEHFGAGEHADRAHAALLGAVELAADLASLAGIGGGPPVVSVTLPDAYAGRPEVLALCDGLGVLVEDFGAAARAERAPDDGGDAGAANASHASSLAAAGDSVRPGIDTGRLILHDRPPGKTFAKFSKRAATLRLNDADDTGRRPMGGGTLDLGTIMALHATLTPSLPIVTDLRGLDDPDRGAHAALDRIGEAGTLPGAG